MGVMYFGVFGERPSGYLPLLCDADCAYIVGSTHMVHRKLPVALADVKAHFPALRKAYATQRIVTFR